MRVCASMWPGGAKMRRKCALGRFRPEDQAVVRQSWREGCGEPAFGEKCEQSMISRVFNGLREMERGSIGWRSVEVCFSFRGGAHFCLIANITCATRAPLMLQFVQHSKLVAWRSTGPLSWDVERWTAENGLSEETTVLLFISFKTPYRVHSTCYLSVADAEKAKKAGRAGGLIRMEAEVGPAGHFSSSSMAWPSGSRAIRHWRKPRPF